MPRLFLGNFDFEHQLADPSCTSSQRLKRINDELAFVWLTIAEDGDALVAPESFEFGFLNRAADAGLPRVSTITVEDVHDRLPHPRGAWELVPWGWTARLRAWAEAMHFQVHAPFEAGVRAANSRRYSYQLEQELGVALPGAAALSTVDACAQAVSTFRDADPWVFKAEFGMSSRERVLGRGRTLTLATARWLARRLARDGVVFLEPWVTCLAEAGLQIDIPESGAPEVVGVAVMLASESGNYEGSRFDSLEGMKSGGFDFSPGIEIGLRAARRIQALGYFGPLGIDMMHYRDAEGNEGWRPLQDINARWTMGRLCLGCRRLLRPGERGFWIHSRWDADFAERLAGDAAAPAGARIVRTTPFSIDGVSPRRMTYLEMHDPFDGFDFL